jgi:two-component system response regulator DegU
LILIVDDNAGMRQTVKAMLMDLDSAFCECDDGGNALEMYQTYHPDWVLMDVRMAEVDGIAATRRIKEAFPDACIIMVSGHNDPILMKEAREAGAIAYVLKDDLSELLNIIGTPPGDQA